MTKHLPHAKRISHIPTALEKPADLTDLNAAPSATSTEIAVRENDGPWGITMQTSVCPSYPSTHPPSPVSPPLAFAMGRVTRENKSALSEAAASPPAIFTTCRPFLSRAVSRVTGSGVSTRVRSPAPRSLCSATLFFSVATLHPVLDPLRAAKKRRKDRLRVAFPKPCSPNFLRHQ